LQHSLIINLYSVKVHKVSNGL